MQQNTTEVSLVTILCMDILTSEMPEALATESSWDYFYPKTTKSSLAQLRAHTTAYTSSHKAIVLSPYSKLKFAIKIHKKSLHLRLPLPALIHWDRWRIGLYTTFALLWPNRQDLALQWGARWLKLCNTDHNDPPNQWLESNQEPSNGNQMRFRWVFPLVASVCCWHKMPWQSDRWGGG